MVELDPPLSVTDRHDLPTGGYRMAPGSSAGDSTASRPVKKVLVADDEVWVRRLVAATLMGEPYQVIEARNGNEAVEIARTQRPDLVLLDVRMPGLDGLAVCRAVRADPELAATTVVILSGERVSDAEGAAAGANHVIHKPFSPLQLLGFIDAALQ